MLTSTYPFAPAHLAKKIRVANWQGSVVNTGGCDLRTLCPLTPVSWTAMEMHDSIDSDRIVAHAIHQAIGKTIEQVAANAASKSLPGIRIVPDSLDTMLGLGDESISQSIRNFSIVRHRRVKFI